MTQCRLGNHDVSDFHFQGVCVTCLTRLINNAVAEKDMPMRAANMLSECRLHLKDNPAPLVKDLVSRIETLITLLSK